MTSSATTPQLSVVMPAYNEEACLEAVVRRTEAELAGLGPSFEIIVVDDASADGTWDIARRLEAELPRVRALRNPANRGYGGAVKTGWAASRGEWITAIPSDGQVRSADLGLLLARMGEADLVLGVRPWRSGYTPFRLFSSAVFMLLMRVLFLAPVRDVNWIHCYRRWVMEAVRVDADGVFFCGEFVVRALRAGACAVQVGFPSHAREAGEAQGGKPSVILRTLADMFRFRLRLWAGAGGISPGEMMPVPRTRGRQAA